MSPVCRIKRRKTHQPVDAALTLEVAVPVPPVQLQSCRLDTGNIALLPIYQFDIVIVALAPPDIHTKKHLRPVATFRSARSGVDGQNHTENILFVAHHIAEFQLFNLLQRRFIARLHLRFLSLSLVEEIIGHDELVILLFRFREIRNPRFRKTDLLENFLGGFRIFPKVVSVGYLLLLGNFFLLPVDVKDTSLAR